MVQLLTDRVKHALRSEVHRHDVRDRFLAGIPGEARVLDLGCGVGSLACAVLRRSPSARVHGVDILDPNDVSSSVRYTQHDLNSGQLPFADDTFDVVLLVHVVEHLSNPLELAPEIRRVLHQGGRAYVETPNWSSTLVPSFSMCREQHQPFNFYDDPSHLKPWSQHGVFEFLHSEAGLRNVRVGSSSNLLRIPQSVWRLGTGVLSSDRPKVVSAVWNLTRWTVYGIGESA